MKSIYDINFNRLRRKATFLERLNRFVALIKEQNGKKTQVHVPNSGKLKELLQEGAEVVIMGQPGKERKTAGDLTLVYTGAYSSPICIDSRLPPRILEYSISSNGAGGLLQGWEIFKREPAYGKGRFDLLLSYPGNKKDLGHNGSSSLWIETKSVTLAREQRGWFPDAPTARGSRHLEELVDVVKEGHRAAVFFIAQREDVNGFSPNDHTDPLFGKKLREAFRQGVEVYAYNCRVSENGISLHQALPVIM